jgi:hypothetical protein
MLSLLAEACTGATWEHETFAQTAMSCTNTSRTCKAQLAVREDCGTCRMLGSLVHASQIAWAPVPLPLSTHLHTQPPQSLNEKDSNAS